MSQGPNLIGDVGPGIASPTPPQGAPIGAPPPSPVVTDMADGGVEIDVSDHETDPEPPPGHDDNLAETMEESDLAKIATQIIDWVDDDKKSRSEWEGTLTAGLELLGLKIADRSTPFAGATGVFDTLMLEAVLRNQAQTTGELLPAAGPVKTQIIGESNEQTEQKATRVKAFMNAFLMELAPEWLENHEQLFLWRAIAGSVFTKTYQDPILNRPVSPFITPDKLIINYYADAEMESVQRVTHVLDMSYKEIRERQLNGFYADVELTPPTDDGSPDSIQDKVDAITGFKPPPGDSTVMYDKNFEVYESHIDLDLKDFEHKDAEGENSGLPLPYIVTVETTTKRVLAIRKNWRENDKAFKRQQYFTHWRLIPGLGFYGIGYAHILGNPAKAATALQRQMIDAATLEMFPGGLRVKGMRMDDNNKMIGPCEFQEIDTGGLPINQAISPMPYKGPSQWSFELWKAGRENAQSLGNMADISVGDGRQDAPVGTTLALLEAANRMMSSTIKSAHRSMKRELKLFAALFGQYLPKAPYPFPVAGGQQAIMRADFTDDIDVIPVSDPNITSYAQRVTRAEMLVRFAQQFPQVHDIRAALQNMYVEAGVDERKIDAILPQPTQAQPSDPLTENQMALTGKPLAVAEWQDHQAHITSHQVLSDQVPSLAAHISEHLGSAMRVNVQKTLGIQLPPMGTKLPPQIENQIAVMVAQALQHLKSPQGPDPSPGQIALAEIQVEAQKVQVELNKITAKAAETAYKERMANTRAEADRRTTMAINMMKEQTAQARFQAQQARAQRQKGKSS